jgi:hypothetical protein
MIVSLSMELGVEREQDPRKCGVLQLFRPPRSFDAALFSSCVARGCSCVFPSQNCRGWRSQEQVSMDRLQQACVSAQLLSIDLFSLPHFMENRVHITFSNRQCRISSARYWLIPHILLLNRKEDAAYCGESCDSRFLGLGPVRSLSVCTSTHTPPNVSKLSLVVTSSVETTNFRASGTCCLVSKLANSLPIRCLQMWTQRG